jgi:hypothetical protein
MRNLLAAILVGAVFPGCAVLPSTVTLSEGDLQRHFDERFPVRHSIAKFGVELKHPIVRLRDDTNRVHLSVDAAIDFPLVRKFPATTEVSGKVRYDPGRTRLYLDEPRIERLDVPVVDAVYEVMFSEITNLGARFLPSIPIYTLGENSGFKQSYARKNLTSVEVRNRTLVLTFD